ncbi:hypothetical protein B0H17DRAFT_1207248 [Mycena rosella]|uniref:Amidohydrolase-related domain-containing protein n=1 Tax=Mycena rosella TaxID=1033263 RepID=A0AAD7D3B7_MYCRO|nr:hypothetical protein B0H17DRAFT_1207248 [Mycena rosella]
MSAEVVRLYALLRNLAQIPFDLWRLDHKLDRDRFPEMQMAKNKTIRDYFGTNMHITTSGHFSTRSLQGAIAELSSSRIMFSIDYPYEDGLMEGSTWFDALPLSQPDLLAISRENALRLLKLDCVPHNMKPGLTLKELEIGGLWGPYIRTMRGRLGLLTVPYTGTAVVLTAKYG